MRITLTRGRTSQDLFSYVTRFLGRKPSVDEVGIGKFNYLMQKDDQKGISGNLEEGLILKRAKTFLQENPSRVFEAEIDFPSPPVGDSRESYSVILDSQELEGFRNVAINVRGDKEDKKGYFLRTIGRLSLPVSFQTDLIDIAKERALEQRKLYFTWPSFLIARYTERVH